MLICLKTVNVKKEHFKKNLDVDIVLVGEGDVIDILPSSKEYLLKTGYFKEKPSNKKELAEPNDTKDSPATG